MNNKGFTLVELLAVIVLLLAISVVAVTNVTSSLKRTEKKELESYEKIAINAAKIYFSMTDNESSDVNDSVAISTLISLEYIKDATKFEELEKYGRKLDTYYVKVCASNYQVLLLDKACE